MKHVLNNTLTLVMGIAIGLFASATAFAQVNIFIQNTDPAGSGFNDPTPAAPVGGNNGTTVGQQRLNVFQAAADIWGATLSSGQTITISAHWADLSCTATSGVLGQAGATSRFANFGFGVPSRWYGPALAEALSNTNLSAGPEINATFNQKLGQPGCLQNTHWYYGLDNNHGSDGIDLLTVLLHEFGHGLGFQTFTNTSTGAFAGNPTPLPSIWDDFLFDDTAGKSWSQMATDGERQASAINTGNLVWIGPNVDADVPRGVLSGTPRLRVNSPASIGGNYQVGSADFGPSLTSGGTTGKLVQALDPADGAGPSTTDGCSAFTNAAAVAGGIALIDRGTCTFVSKTKNAQNAGAVGVVIVDNDPANNPPPGLGGGPDNTITIPAVRITTADGNTIKAQLSSPGVNVSLFSDISHFAGTDATGRPLMYAPSTVASGSSVSHWDTSLLPDQLMEPNISGLLSHSSRAPLDLTLSLLRDIGWPINPNAASTILVEEGTNVAAAVDSVTFTRGPFTVLTPYNFAGDGHRRIVIFTTPLLPANPSVSVTANGIPLTVESAGTFNALAGTSYIVVVLPSLAAGNYALAVTVNSVGSTNSPTITIQ